MIKVTTQHFEEADDFLAEASQETLENYISEIQEKNPYFNVFCFALASGLEDEELERDFYYYSLIILKSFQIATGKDLYPIFKDEKEVEKTLKDIAEKTSLVNTAPNDTERDKYMSFFMPLNQIELIQNINALFDVDDDGDYYEEDLYMISMLNLVAKAIDKKVNA